MLVYAFAERRTETDRDGQVGRHTDKQDKSFEAYHKDNPLAQHISWPTTTPGPESACMQTDSILYSAVRAP